MNSIYLTKYFFDDKGRLSEKDSKNLMVLGIPEWMEQSLRLKDIFTSRVEIYEEDSVDLYNVNCIDIKNIDTVLKILENMKNNPNLCDGCFEGHATYVIINSIKDMVLEKKSKYIEDQTILIVFEGAIY
jgi:hypothetical protein